MRSLSFFIIVSIFVTSCYFEHQEKKERENRESYVIKVADTNRIRYDSLTGEEIIPIRAYYFDYNIILIDSLDEIYYHKQRFFCLTGREIPNNLPFFRNLKPEYFNKSKNLGELLNQISIDSIPAKNVYLVANTDTIYDNRYFKLKKELIRKGIRVSTRKLTEEENAIITAVLNQKKYKPEEIRWENTLSVPEDFYGEFEIDIEEH